MSYSLPSPDGRTRCLEGASAPSSRASSCTSTAKQGGSCFRNAASGAVGPEAPLPAAQRGVRRVPRSRVGHGGGRGGRRQQPVAAGHVSGRGGAVCGRRRRFERVPATNEGHAAGQGCAGKGGRRGGVRRWQGGHLLQPNGPKRGSSDGKQAVGGGEGSHLGREVRESPAWVLGRVPMRFSGTLRATCE